MGRLERALDCYQKSLAEVEAHFGRNDSYRLLCGNCAAILRRLGDTAEAERYEQLGQEGAE